MKKLCALLILCLATTIQADPLSDAIRASDVEKVRLLLSQTTLTDKEFIKYLDTAEQTVHTRRNNMILLRIDSNVYSEESRLYTKYALKALAGMILSAGALTYYGFSENKFGMFVSAASGGLLSMACLMSLAASAGAQIQDNIKRIKELYSNALSIKEMLHDSSDFIAVELVRKS